MVADCSHETDLGLPVGVIVLDYADGVYPGVLEADTVDDGQGILAGLWKEVDVMTRFYSGVDVDVECFCVLVNRIWTPRVAQCAVLKTITVLQGLTLDQECFQNAFFSAKLDQSWRWLKSISFPTTTMFVSTLSNPQSDLLKDPLITRTLRNIRI